MLKCNLVKQVFITVFLLAGFVTQALADFVGFHAGVVQWDQAWEGNVDTAKFGDNVGVEDDNSTGFYASMELPIPFIPNLKLQTTPMSTTGKINTAFVYDGEATTVGSDIDISLDQQDAIFYGEILDNWLSLDMGIGIRRYDAEFVIENGANDIQDDVSAVIPMIYAALRFDLPFSGFYGLGEVLTLPAGDNVFTDLKTGIGYESKLGLGAQAGFRSSSIELDDVDDLSSDLTVDGAYLALTLHL